MRQHVESRARQLALCAIVVLALVGMHHLVVTGCQLGPSQTTSIATLDVVHVDHESTPPAPHGSEDTQGDHGLLLMCLAIVGVTILLALHGTVARAPRQSGHDVALERPTKAADARPPDLSKLSVLRT